MVLFLQHALLRVPEIGVWGLPYMERVVLLGGGCLELCLAAFCCGLSELVSISSKLEYGSIVSQLGVGLDNTYIYHRCLGSVMGLSTFYIVCLFSRDLLCLGHNVPCCFLLGTGFVTNWQCHLSW